VIQSIVERYSHNVIKTFLSPGVKGANNNQVYMHGNLEFGRVFLMKKNFFICDIPLRSHFVSDDNNPSQYAITCIFQ